MILNRFGHRREGVVEKFFGAEEAGEFGFGGFAGIGGVGDVDHDVEAEVAADGAGGGFAGIGGAEEFADLFDGVFGFEGDGDDGALLHEGLDFGVEGFLDDVGVVFGEDGIAEAHHFAAANAEAGFLETLEDFAGEGFGDAIGLEEDEGGFHGVLC